MNTPPGSAPPLPLGEVFAEIYRPVQVLARGGMGWVYLAEVDLDRFDIATVLAQRERGRGTARARPDTRRRTRLVQWARRSRGILRGIVEEEGIPYPSDGRCALKVLSLPDEIERFESEWKALATAIHPNLIPVYGGGCSDGLHYYAMEVVPDPFSLDRLIGDLTLAEKVVVARDAARGLAELHRMGIVHRDVSPSNLLVHRNEDSQPITRICDLGVGKHTLRAAPITGTGIILGNPYYMSPEQVRASSEVGPLSDIYSLGASLYHLVTGRAPYPGNDLFAIVERILDDDPPDPIAESAPQTPRGVQKFIERSIALNPEDRPASMEQAIEQLEGLILALADETTPSRRPGTTSITRRRAPEPRTPPIRRTSTLDPRHRTWLSLAIPLAPTLLALGLSLALVLHWWRSFPDPSAAEPSGPLPPPSHVSPVLVPPDPDLPTLPPTIESERAHLREAIESALRLIDSDHDIHRALEELDSLTDRAEQLDLASALESARGRIATAQKLERQIWTATLRTAVASADLEVLARRLLLFDATNRREMRSILEHRATELGIDPLHLPATENRR